MPTGRSGIQRGSSRGGQKLTKEAKKPPQSKIEQDKLAQMKADYEELYGHAERAAKRVGVSEEEKVPWLISFMEDVIKRVTKQRKEQQLLAENKRSREQTASQ
jgi:tRNA C32,U32 (ribose-2'-O)-methylase TrmJ